jgi:hypothetical protein
MRLCEITKWTDDKLVELCQKMEPLIPQEGLPATIKKLVPGCEHPESAVCQKVAKGGALMYFKVCTTCGASLPCEKGELSHRNVALRYRVEDIESKGVFDLAGEEFNSRIREQRSKLLQAYSEYLQSPQWHALRQAVIQRDGSCRVCEDQIECVHHVTYERLFDEDLSDLVGVCQPCHELIHEVAP